MQSPAHLHNTAEKSKPADLCNALSSSQQLTKITGDGTDPCIAPVLINASDSLPMVIVLKQKCVSFQVRVTIIDSHCIC